LADRESAPICRAYRPGDREELVALWELCELTRPWNDPYRDIDRKQDRDADNLLVLEENGRLIGSVMFGYDGHRGSVNYLAVHPEQRQRGLGRMLMATAEERLTALGCPKVNLQVRGSNKATVEFYRRVGYIEDDVLSLGRRLIPDKPIE